MAGPTRPGQSMPEDTAGKTARLTTGRDRAHGEDSVGVLAYVHLRRHHDWPPDEARRLLVDFVVAGMSAN
jgi:hypothetical protein